MSVLYNELNRLEEKEQKQDQLLHGLAKGKLDLNLPKEIMNDFYDLKEYIRISSRRSSRRSLAFISPRQSKSSAMISTYVGYLLSGASPRSMNARSIAPSDQNDTRKSQRQDHSFFKEGFEQDVSKKDADENLETLSGVLLIDTNLHQPEIHNYLNMSVTDGLADILERDFQWQRLVKNVSGTEFDVITAGRAKAPAVELLTSDNFLDLVRSVQKKYRYVLFNAPPVLNFSEALSIAALADGTVMVVQAGITRWEEAQVAKRKLLTAHANLLGVVLDKQKQ